MQHGITALLGFHMLIRAKLNLLQFPYVSRCRPIQGEFERIVLQLQTCESFVRRFY